MSNFLKRTKRASEEIAYDEFHKGMKDKQNKIFTGHLEYGIQLHDTLEDAAKKYEENNRLCHPLGDDDYYRSFKSGVAYQTKCILSVLDTNLQVQIAGYYNIDKTDAEREKRNAVIEEYKDLIAILKSKNAE